MAGNRQQARSLCGEGLGRSAGQEEGKLCVDMAKTQKLGQPASFYVWLISACVRTSDSSSVASPEAHGRYQVTVVGVLYLLDSPYKHPGG